MNKIIKIIFWFLIIVLFILVVIFYYFFVGKANIARNITWGVDFSQSQAEYLKLDWKEAYLEIIKDLRVKNIKLHTNWSWVEGIRDDYYFKDIDWQIKKAEENNVKIIYVLGMKTGRWPECHMPEWTKGIPEEEIKSGLLNYITQVVQRYKNSESIAFWQVENEPLFKFGECPNWYYKNSDFLEKEVDLVKYLDPSRKIIISDSGEQSMWFGAAKIGDIVGITTYRKAWMHITDSLGFNFPFSLNPLFYARKAKIIEKMFSKKVIGIELQAEPWIKSPLMESSLDEQLKSMNLKSFQENVEFAKKTSFDTFYFWGVEWWYWLKETQNKPEIWDQAKTLF